MKVVIVVKYCHNDIIPKITNKEQTYKMIPYNNVTIFVSLSWKIYILVHYQHFEDRQVNIYKVNININFSIFISCNKNETNIPLFQFQMMYLNYFLNKIVKRIKNLFSKKKHCASIIIIIISIGL